MRVLIGCEYSGTVREAFKKRGHYALSCDLLPTDIPGNHYQGDIFDVIDDNWDLGIFHPPCTFLTNSGVRWLHTQPGRWDNLKQGAEFFKRLLNCNIPKKALENPIPHKYAMELIGEPYTQIVQPYQFGHLEKKSTCLWLKGLPPIVETNNVYNEMMKLPYAERAKVHHASPGPNRWKFRSTTYKGIAEAMAEQWG